MSVNISGASAAPGQYLAEILTPDQAAQKESIIDHPPGAYALIIGDPDNQMIMTGTLPEIRHLVADLARQIRPHWEATHG